MRTKQNYSAGFLPLLALIIIGAVTVGSAGYGVTKYIQNKNKKQEAEPVNISTPVQSEAVEKSADNKEEVKTPLKQVKENLKLPPENIPAIDSVEEVDKKQQEKEREEARHAVEETHQIWVDMMNKRAYGNKGTTASE